MEFYFSRSLLVTEPTFIDKLKGITESLKTVDLGKMKLAEEGETLYGHKTHESLSDLNIALAFKILYNMPSVLKNKRKRIYIIKVISDKLLKFFQFINMF